MENKNIKLHQIVLQKVFKQLNLTEKKLQELSSDLYDKYDSPKKFNQVFEEWQNTNYPEGFDSQELEDFISGNPQETQNTVISHSIIREFHLAERWDKIQQNKENRPYLLYRTAGDNSVRPTHKTLDGILLPVNHSFWDSHFPPNGFGCRCGIRTVSERDLKKKGWEVTPEHEVEEILLAIIT